MVGLVRFLALAVFAGALAGCITDGMIGAEAEGDAKSRVVDAPKTKNTAKKDSAKKDTAKADAARSTLTAQGDTAVPIVTARVEPEVKQPEDAAEPRRDAAIPARTLFGNWTLGHEGGNPCRVILGGVPIGNAYAARGEPDCPKAFTAVQTWEIQGDELVLRNGSRGIVGRLQPTGPSRFDGKGDSGAPVYLMR
jgi:hypothetical protein